MTECFVQTQRVWRTNEKSGKSCSMLSIVSFRRTTHSAAAALRP